MNKHLKIVSLAAALCGAVACSSSDNGTSSSTGGPGTTGASGGNGSSSGGASTGTAAGGQTGSGGSSTGAPTTGGTTTGAPGPSTYPCVDGGFPYMPSNPPASLPFCWCNPGDAGALSYYQIINSCPPSGSTPDLSIPLPPPVGTESITGLDNAGLPLFVDAGAPGAQ